MGKYYNCKTQSNFEQKEQLCCQLLGLPYSDDSTINYAKPLIDINGDYWLIINDEVISVLTESELNSCVEFSEVPLNFNI